MSCFSTQKWLLAKAVNRQKSPDLALVPRPQRHELAATPQTSTISQQPTTQRLRKCWKQGDLMRLRYRNIGFKPNVSDSTRSTCVGKGSYWMVRFSPGTRL